MKEEEGMGRVTSWLLGPGMDAPKSVMKNTPIDFSSHCFSVGTSCARHV